MTKIRNFILRDAPRQGAGKHADRRNRRNRTRSAQKRRALQEQS